MDKDVNKTTEEQKDQEPQWYVVHTYSGYENKVKDGLDALIDNRDLRDQILEVRIPTREVIETKDGKKHVSEKKLFPGYVMIKMIYNNDIWYVIRNTRGVTGFVGPEAKPTPLSEEELVTMGFMQKEEPIIVDEFQVGDNITVIEGPLLGNTGVITDVIPAQEKVRANLSMFGGRQIPTELEFKQIHKEEL